MKKRVENIIIEVISLILLVIGMSKFYLEYHSEKYDAIKNNDFQKFEELTSDSLGWFIAQYSFWELLILISCGILIVLFKYFKNEKKGIVNTLISILIVFFIFRFRLLNSYIFSGIIYCLIGVWILYNYLSKKR